MNGDDTDLLTLQPLQGIPKTALPEEEASEEQAPGTMSVQEAPEHMPLPPETMVLSGKYYGKHFGEDNRDANFGPEGQELNDDDVALSPNVAERLGLERGDKVWVGNRLHTYNDVSAYTPHVMTRDTVEVRNYPLDGKIQVRKAMPEEVERHERGDIRQMPSAMMTSYMTGLDPSKITAADVNAIVQPQIEQQRGLIAGDITGESLENWNLDQLNQQNEVASSAQADEFGEVTPASMGLETSGEQLPGGVLTGAGEGIPVPPNTGAHIVDRKDGKLIWSNGVIGDPATGSIQFHVGPKTVIRYADGRTQSFDTNSIYRDPSTGYTYDKTKPGMPRVVLEGQIPDLKPGVTGEDALKDLTEPQKNIVRMIGNYQLVLPPSALRSASFLPYLARVSAYTNGDYSTMKAVGRQQMIKSIATMAPNSAGYIITSANTMLEHLQQLYKDAQQLPLHDLKKGNALLNVLKDNAGSPSVTNFQFTKNALLTELTKTLKGGVADDSDMRRWSDALNAADSKAQMDDLIKKDFPDILAGRLNGFRFLYQTVMDHPYEQVDKKTGQRATLVSPSNAAWLKKIGYDGNIDAGDPVQQPAKEVQNIQAGLPAKGTADVQGAKLWLAGHPNAPQAAEIRDWLLRLGEMPAPSPTPAAK